MDSTITFFEESDEIIDYILKNEEDIRFNCSEAKEYINDIIVNTINKFNKQYKGKKI